MDNGIKTAIACKFISEVVDANLLGDSSYTKLMDTVWDGRDGWEVYDSGLKALAEGDWEKVDKAACELEERRFGFCEKEGIEVC